MLFQLDRVSVIRQGKALLQNISISIQEGCATAIVGPSGAGKTTLLRLFNLMTIPTSGTIRFRGKDIFAYPLLAYRRRISIVFQEPVLFDGTVEANLLLPLRTGSNGRSLPSQETLEEALSASRLIPDILNEDSRILSGGEKQRVAIARALLMAPEVLLLDEPTSALDIETADRIISAIQKTYPGMTLIAVTHSPEMIRKFEAKIIIKAGRIISCCNRLTTSGLHQILESAE